ncbi:MAG: Dabb family protein [Porticoccaceae bacterium]
MIGSENDVFALDQPVRVIDRLQVRPGRCQEVIALFDQIYRPLAEQRGLEWVDCWIAPPFEREQTGAELVIHWQYPSLGALWAARGVEDTDSRLVHFWRDRLAPLLISRTRQLGRSGPLQAIPPSGPAPALPASYRGTRNILFLRPDGTVPASEQPSWLDALQRLAGTEGIRACDAGFNAGSYTGRDGEITVDLLLEDGAAVPDRMILASLPGPAVIDEVVAPALPIAWGHEPRALTDGVKRTILLKVRDDASPEEIATLEQALIEWAQQLPEMACWSLSRVAATTGSVPWSHCYEQEFTVASAVLGSYLNHPFHWAVVDRYFHPEAHQQAADRFFHSVRAAAKSLLVPILGGD